MSESSPPEPRSPFHAPSPPAQPGWLGELSVPFMIILRRWLFRSAINAPLPLLGALILYQNPWDLLGVVFGFGFFVLGIAGIDLKMRLAGGNAKVLQALARGSITMAWLQLFFWLQMSIATPVAFLVLGTVGRVRFVSPALITVLYGSLSLVIAYGMGSIANSLHNPYPKRD